MAKAKLTKEQEQAIKEYGEQIKTLASFMEAIRKRPGMYVGTIGPKGFLNMVREVVQNSNDQIMMQGGIATTIIITYDENSKIVIVEDDGLGIPFGMIIRVFTKQHTGKNFEKKEGDFSSGTYGIGSKATNALSNYFIVRSYRLGEGREMRFEKGVPVYDEEKVIPNEGKQGTRIEFQVDESIMGDCTLSWEVMFSLFSTILSLSKKGATLLFNAITRSGQEIHERFINTDGILTGLIAKTTKPLISPIFISECTPEKTIDIVFTYDSENMDEEDITSYANMSPTTGGTHVDGFVDGLCKFFRDYMNKIYLANKKNKLTVVNSDVKTGLKVMIHAKHIEPVLEGQSKEKLTNPDMYKFAKDVTITQLNKWYKTNPDDMQKLCKYIKEIADIRTKAEKGKEKLVNKYNTNSLTSLPPKFKKQTSKDRSKWEFWIVEGDSAGGSAKRACSAHQAILPIRGKMPNAFTTPRAKFLDNDEVKAFFAIVGGGGIGSKFDIKKAIYPKVIIGADADVDGLHIATLILQMCLLYALPLIEDGRVYRSVPPLFGIKKGNSSYKYYTTEFEYLEYVESLFTKDNDIRFINNTKVPKKELQYLLNLNIDYTYLMSNISSTYALDPKLLEDIILNSDLGYNNLYNVLHKKYKYLDIHQKNGISIIDGLVGNNINTIYLTDRFFNDIKPLKDIVLSNQFTSYKINGEEKSLYEFMTLFDNYKPSNIERYKGLGEMNASQLGDSTMDVNNRVLVRYTVQSAKEEIARIRYLESNRHELIMGTSATRHDL